MSAPVVRAKFQCLEIKHHFTTTPDSVMVEIRMAPVYGNGTENKDWSKWTPAGELKMTITNPPAAEKFEIGKCYFLDFTPVD